MKRSITKIIQGWGDKGLGRGCPSCNKTRSGSKRTVAYVTQQLGNVRRQLKTYWSPLGITATAGDIAECLFYQLCYR